jgi:hypothetical protein
MCSLRFRRRYLSPCRTLHTHEVSLVGIICINRTEYTYTHTLRVYIYIGSGHTGRVIRSLIRYARFASLGHPPTTSRHFHPPKRSPFESERLSCSVFRQTVPVGRFYRARARILALAFSPPPSPTTEFSQNPTNPHSLCSV